ncbi:hypothetical protein M407DRAFT_105407 [Tulasnella calospora MUT 4182]|uniref:Uncharacterized protein n=1 Tax=Tulasnella calospora MUT 4182 TaxID=1051891 RepID=A0A0C3QJM7_9AGAM|nr:hypothetical protein M407DRAFT_105407 [Tulasnella calospora MUT 4182]
MENGSQSTQSISTKKRSKKLTNRYRSDKMGDDIVNERRSWCLARLTVISSRIGGGRLLGSNLGTSCGLQACLRSSREPPNGGGSVRE